MMFILFIFLSFLITLFLVKGLITLLPRLSMMDLPNHRSSHQIPTPRGGGIAFVLLWFLLYSVGSTSDLSILSKNLWVLLPSGFLVALVGFIDDFKGLHIKWRMLAYLIASALFLGLLYETSDIHYLQFFQSSFSILIEVIAFFFFIAWSINLFNFMDGIDGIAALEALFVFIPGGLLLYLSGHFDLARSAWLLSAISAGFFVWNFPKAKIFMGDVGSAFLGFMIMALGVMAKIKGHFPLLLWLMLYGLFLFDATVTLIRRFLAGEVWYKAHRLHAYQRLQALNYSHRKILAIVTIMNTVIVLLTFFTYFYPTYWKLSVSVELILLGLSYLQLERLQPMFPKAEKNSDKV